MEVLTEQQRRFSAADTHFSATTPTPIVLHQLSTVSVRRHMFRDARRVVTLIIADTAVLLLLRIALKAVRDQALLGSSIGRLVNEIFPRGTVPLPQIFSALVLTLMVLGTYGTGDRRCSGRRISLACFVALGPIFWNAIWTDFSLYLVVAYLVAGVAVSAALVAERWLLDWAVRHSRAATAHHDRTLIVGPTDAARRAVGFSTVYRQLGLRVFGFIDTSSKPADDAVGGALQLVRAIENLRIDTLIIAGELGLERFQSVVEVGAQAGCRVLSVPRSSSGGIVVPELVSYRGVPFIELTRPGLKGHQLVIKRTVDLLVATVALIVLSPVFLVLAAAVKLQSSGPVFFRQTRVGAGGRLFRIFKFRSMVAAAEQMKAELTDDSVYKDARLFKVKNDPRVTPLGRFLRRSSLDELPQLFNVLKGDMSLVGPRPPVPSEVAFYQEHHYARFAMKPGITGPWQVGGRNHVVDFDQVILLEQGYMRDWHIWKDIEILVRTIPAVLRMDGAY